MTYKAARRPRRQGKRDSHIMVDSDLLSAVQDSVAASLNLPMSATYAVEYAVRDFLKRNPVEAH